jgi:DNA-3-methyladenine glycosylase II
LQVTHSHYSTSGKRYDLKAERRLFLEIFQYGQQEIEYLKKKDKRLAEAIDRIGFIEREVIPDLFAALVNSIVGQQISMKAADTIWARLLDRVGVITPESILAVPAEEIQKCGMTMKKALYIQDAAQKILNGEFNIHELAELPDDEVCKRLSSLNGIGVWTAEMLMIFSMQRKDIVSWGDLALKRGMMALYHHKELNKERFERYRKRYSPYGTIASFYLWEASRGL